MTRDDERFEAFCSREYERVFRAALALSGRRDVAQDATQEAFGRALSRWGRLRKQPWAGGWVMTTALNLCRSDFHHRRRLTQVRSSVVDWLTEPPCPERVDLVSALRALPLRQRQAVILHYIGDLPVHIVAELMNTADGTVKSYLWRARRSLRLALAESDDLSRRKRKVRDG